ncbi:MAG: endonuclease domain-containing protein [Verrucomicrobiia bacterium]
MNSRHSLARSLRKTPTWAERVLWRNLRNRSFAQFKFRRQHPVGPYVVDFYRASRKLAVELDGDVHGVPDHRSHDIERDAYLAKQGIQVLRFWNVEVQENLDGLLDVIYAELCAGTANPHPEPLPCAARERGQPMSLPDVN